MCPKGQNVPQLTKRLSNTHKALGLIPTQYKPDVVVYAKSKVEARGSSNLCLYNQFKANLGYMRLSNKNTLSDLDLGALSWDSGALPPQCSCLTR